MHGTRSQVRMGPCTLRRKLLCERRCTKWPERGRAFTIRAIQVTQPHSRPGGSVALPNGGGYANIEAHSYDKEI
jgi:hypothetical protein